MQFLERQEALFQSAKALTPFLPETTVPIDAKLRAREDLIHALFNRGEFVTIR
jgi:hypothetical protein